MIPGNEYGLHLRYVGGGDTTSSMISGLKQPFRQYVEQLFEMDNPPVKLRTAVLKEEMPATRDDTSPSIDTLITNNLKVQEFKKASPPKRLRILKS